MARATFVNKARKAYKAEGIKKGDSYYWWKFRFGPVHRSKTRPKRSQLTQSEFYATLWSIQDSLEETAHKLGDAESLGSHLDDMINDLEALRDEQEEKRNNMPDQLQDSDTGNMLQERYDALEEYINELTDVKNDCEDEEADLDDLITRATSCDCSV